MVKASEVRRPSLIVVTGRPGSGKTTLAHRLAQAVRCPIVCRDEIKEGLVHALGDLPKPSQELQGQAYETFFSVIELLLKHRVTLVAEAAFQHERWAQKLEPIKKLARLRIVICTVAPQLARTRQIARSLADPGWERFHGDPGVPSARDGREPSISDYDPPRLDVPTLNVDTTENYQPGLEAIVSFANSAGIEHRSLGMR